MPNQYTGKEPCLDQVLGGGTGHSGPVLLGVVDQKGVGRKGGRVGQACDEELEEVKGGQHVDVRAKSEGMWSKST